jgi:hypothetical protein
MLDKLREILDKCPLFDQVITLLSLTLVSNRESWLGGNALDVYSKCAPSNLDRDCFRGIFQALQANAGLMHGLGLDRMHRNPFQFSNHPVIRRYIIQTRTKNSTNVKMLEYRYTYIKELFWTNTKRHIRPGIIHCIESTDFVISVCNWSK